MAENKRPYQAHQTLAEFCRGRGGLQPSDPVAGTASRLVEAALAKGGILETSVLEDGALKLALSRPQGLVVLVEIRMDGRLETLVVDEGQKTVEKGVESSEGEVWMLLNRFGGEATDEVSD